MMSPRQASLLQISVAEHPAFGRHLLVGGMRGHGDFQSPARDHGYRSFQFRWWIPVPPQPFGGDTESTTILRSVNPRFSMYFRWRIWA